MCEETISFYSNWIRDPKLLQMRMFKQHKDITTYEHSLNVLNLSISLAKKLHFSDKRIRNIIVGSMLHDYFLYDWHDKEYLSQRKRLHGFRHPMTALENAEKEYNLSDTQREIIRKHMWPLTIVPPTCGEAWVVTAADKYCSFRETVGLRKGHGKRAV